MNLGKKHVHNYSPRGGCAEVFESREPEVLISGPAGTGKSRACLEKVALICFQTPNVRALLLRKTARSLGSTGLVTWRNFVIKEALATGDVVYYGGSQQEAAQYRFKNGSTVTIGGLDNPTRIMSSEYDIVYVQEATEITIVDLEYIKTRLRNWVISFQQLLMDCNPSTPTDPLKQRCTSGKTKLIESRHEDNPRLFEECLETDAGAVPYPYVDSGWVKPTQRGKDYIAILDALTGVRYKRLRLGLWVSADGIVYEEFDPAVHILKWSYSDDGEKLPLPDDWERIWVIDFGYIAPFVLACYAIDPDDGALILYREIYFTNRTVEEHAKTILDIVCPEKVITWYDHINRIDRSRTEREWIEPLPLMVICDHDAEGRRTFEKHTGLGTKAAKKAVALGIDLTKTRIAANKFFIMEDTLVELDQTLLTNVAPTCTADEFGGYVWKVNKDGELLDEPVKRNDHGLDTLRYVVTELDFRGKARGTVVGD